MRWRLACVIAAALVAGAAAAAERPQARSDDGRWQVVAEGHAVAVYDGGVRVKTLAATARDGHDAPSAVAAIHHVGARRSFVIAFDTLAELWELSIDPQAAPIFDGLVHDYRQGEAIAAPGYLGARRTQLEQPLGALALDDSGGYVLGRAKADVDGRAQLHLVQLDIRRTIGRFLFDGDPDLAAARTLRPDGRLLLSVPDRQGGPQTVVDLRRARLVLSEGGPR
jgi:hypothetical protein